MWLFPYLALLRVQYPVMLHTIECQNQPPLSVMALVYSAGIKINIQTSSQNPVPLCLLFNPATTEQLPSFHMSGERHICVRQRLLRYVAGGWPAIHTVLQPLNNLLFWLRTISALPATVFYIVFI